MMSDEADKIRRQMQDVRQEMGHDVHAVDSDAHGAELHPGDRRQGQAGPRHASQLASDHELDELHRDREA